MYQNKLRKLLSIWFHRRELDKDYSICLLKRKILKYNRHIVHFPDESKPLYKPKTHEYRANQTQMHEYSFNNKQNIAPSNSQLN